MTPSPTLLHALVEHAATRPDATAVRELQQGRPVLDLTWCQLLAGALALRTRLLAEFPDHTILIALRNGAEVQVALLGALWSGARVLPISPLTPRAELRGLLKRLDSRAIVAERDLCEAMADELMGSIPRDELLSDTDTAPPLELQHRALETAGDSSILLQSSGTTGRPKIVRRGMESLRALGVNLAGALALSPADQLLLTIPMYHSYGSDTGLAAATLAGSAIELHIDS